MEIGIFVKEGWAPLSAAVMMPPGSFEDGKLRQFSQKKGPQQGYHHIKGTLLIRISA